MVAVRPIAVADFFASPQAAQLLAGYAAECAMPGLPEPKPHREIYEALERGGFAHLLGAFDGDNLVGFAVVLASLNPHYSAVLAVIESIYASPAGRSLGAGIALLNTVRGLAREKGAVALLISAPAGSAFARMLNLSEVPHTSNVYCEALA